MLEYAIYFYSYFVISKCFQFQDLVSNATAITVQFILRWNEPRHPNCDITHYKIDISGGIQGTVTIPPNKKEYKFEKLVNLKEESFYGDPVDASNEDITVRTFQFLISADSSTEKLTGKPSFVEASLNKFGNNVSDKEFESSFSNLNFRFVPKILTYDDVEKSIQVFDLDAQKTLLNANIFQYPSIGGANTKNIQIK